VGLKKRSLIFSNLCAELCRSLKPSLRSGKEKLFGWQSAIEVSKIKRFSVSMAGRTAFSFLLEIFKYNEERLYLKI
jgi:hypothetical protein